MASFTVGHVPRIATIQPPKHDVSSASERLRLRILSRPVVADELVGTLHLGRVG